MKLLKRLLGGKLIFLVYRSGGSAYLIKGNNTIYQFFWCGDQSGFGGVGIMLAEKWVNNVISVKRYDHHCLQLRFLVRTTILHAITNIFFRKNKSRLITFSFGGNHTQIDLILVRRAQLKYIKDTKVISSEDCITQHKLLACDLVVSAKPVKPIHITPRRKAWKLKDAVVQKEFEQVVSMKCQNIPAEVESAWEYIKNGLLEAADEICGWTRGTKKLGGGVIMWTM